MANCGTTQPRLSGVRKLRSCEPNESGEIAIILKRKGGISQAPIKCPCMRAGAAWMAPKLRRDPSLLHGLAWESAKG